MDPHHCKAARELLKWKQTDLSEASGVSIATVRRYESGLAPVSADIIQQMRQALEKKTIIFDEDADLGIGVRLKKKSRK